MGKKYFPILLDLEGKDILVVGGGKIAYRKIKTLLEYSGNVEVITDKVVEEKITELYNHGKIKLKIRKFKDCDIDGRFMIVGATDNKDLNKKIYDMANFKNILVNNITTKVDLNARFCAILKEDDYQIGISTDEGNPTRALEIKKKIKESLKV